MRTMKTQKTMTVESKRGAKANSSHSDVRSKPLFRVHKPFYLILAIIDLETGTTLQMQRITKEVVTPSIP
jgi:hypothetical protein